MTLEITDFERDLLFRATVWYLAIAQNDTEQYKAMESLNKRLEPREDE